ncbi:beta-ACP synthase [Helicobacter aurati]|uniref:Beta-ACP synthase n=1 Tax=Helicobacter aurati TaxID=137778 RepID=A0A3D8J8M2_9HELI|nr:beta-ketoacyl synthase N-terminal-like domain-containing protein [Helicobacter aurati]RDU73630.1 beta-ACP synthase [Helicobacter aurati]
MSNPSLVCSAGTTTYEVMKNLLAGKRFLQVCRQYSTKCYCLGKITTLQSLPRDTPIFLQTRTNRILFTALHAIKEMIYTLRKECKRARWGIVIGNTTTGIGENYTAIQSHYDSTKPNAEQTFVTTSQASKDSTKFTYNKGRNALYNPCFFLNQYLNLQALNFGVSSACTSGAKALIQASRLLKCELCDIVIAGGVDSLNALTINGFAALDILSQNPSEPFSESKGINIGEGAGLFLLIHQNLYKQLSSNLKQKFLVELQGYASNNDAFHITNPKLDNKKFQAIIDSLLQSSGLQAQDIDYINLHGTGTQANDSMESELLSQSFANTPCSTIKPMIGHTLGASGAIEAGVCAMLIIESLKNKDGKTFLPPHIANTKASLPTMLNFANNTQKITVKHTLSTSFAFGGDNSILLISASNEEQ